MAKPRKTTSRKRTSSSAGRRKSTARRPVKATRGGAPPTLRTHMTVSQAAKFLDVSAGTLRNWDRAGLFTPLRHPMNSYRLYHRADLLRVKQQLSPRASKVRALPKRGARRRKKR